MRRWLFLLAAVASQVAGATCWNEAGAAYGVHPDLLKAVAKVESGSTPGRINNQVVHRNTNGTRDVCMMQINSSWLPRRTADGYVVTEQDLLADPCKCLYFGAWVLSTNFHRHGVSWDSTGRYNAVTPSKRTNYAWKVYAALQRVR